MLLQWQLPERVLQPSWEDHEGKHRACEGKGVWREGKWLTPILRKSCTQQIWAAKGRQTDRFGQPVNSTISFGEHLDYVMQFTTCNWHIFFIPPGSNKRSEFEECGSYRGCPKCIAVIKLSNQVCQWATGKKYYARFLCKHKWQP